MAEALLPPDARERAAILRTLAARSGQAAIILENDIWVCWVLQALLSLQWPTPTRMTSRAATPGLLYPARRSIQLQFMGQGKIGCWIDPRYNNRIMEEETLRAELKYTAMTAFAEGEAHSHEPRPTVYPIRAMLSYSTLTSSGGHSGNQRGGSGFGCSPPLTGDCKTQGVPYAEVESWPKPCICTPQSSPARVPTNAGTIACRRSSSAPARSSPVR